MSLPVGKIEQLTQASDHGFKGLSSQLAEARAKRAFVRSKALRIRVQRSKTEELMRAGGWRHLWEWKLIEGEGTVLALGPRLYSTRAGVVRAARAMARRFTPELEVAVFP